jgi:hypothetical protein
MNRHQPLPSGIGSLAMLLAMRRASSSIRSLARRVARLAQAGASDCRLCHRRSRVEECRIMETAMAFGRRKASLTWARRYA